MKVVILCGGQGARLSEETDHVPKPLVAIGGKPILWHIMKYYSAWGLKDFILCLGYKGEAIKRYFHHYALYAGDMEIDTRENRATGLHNATEDWTIKLIDTGAETMTGGRLKRVRQYLADESFCMTYADGLSDIDIGASLAFHRAHGRLATVAAVHPPGRFGMLNIVEGQRVSAFVEKGDEKEIWINGGFFVLEPQVIDLIAGDSTVWENEPLERLTADEQLMAYLHPGFWHCMDTLYERRQLERWWNQGKAPWKIW